MDVALMFCTSTMTNVLEANWSGTIPLTSGWLSAAMLMASLAGVAATWATESSVTEPDKKVILVLGDSLAAGYGLEPSEAFPAFLQEKVDAAGLAYKVVNAGVSGDTTAGGLRRIDWL